MSQKKKIDARIKEETHNEIIRMAKEENRTKCGMIANLLELSVQSRINKVNGRIKELREENL